MPTRLTVSRILVATLATSAALAVLPARAADKNTWSTIQRGLYLTRMGDCEACHTNEAGKPFAGNNPLATPFGTIYSANLTPDGETGLGNWSSADFYRAMNKGRDKEGERLYPAFPYPHFTLISREDSDAIFAYLQKLKPIHQEVKAPEFPFPLNIRLAMVGWNWLNFTDKQFSPDPNESASWNRGRYIAEGLGHCGLCHSPKNTLGAEMTGDEAYTGGMAEGWFAPSLRGTGEGGLHDWSKEDVVAFLKDGRNDHATAFGPMAEVVKDSTQYLTDSDVNDLATYLKKLPQDRNAKESDRKPVETASNDNHSSVGKLIYDAQCSACHMQDGKGVAKMFPAVAGSGIVESKNPATLIKLLLEGAKAPQTAKYPTPQAMPAFDWKLNDDQIAAVATYVRSAFGNRAGSVAASDVKDQRTAHEDGHQG